MSLNKTLLSNVKQCFGKTTAQCPACEELGADSKGEHLVIYPNGKYACVAYQGDREHRKRIHKLAGGSTEPRRLTLSVRPFSPPPITVIREIGNLEEPHHVYGTKT